MCSVVCGGSSQGLSKGRNVKMAGRKADVLYLLVDYLGFGERA
jgi:hypothetical protein